MRSVLARLRDRLPTAVVSAVAVVAVVLAATATTTHAVNPAVAFLQSGHWVVNRAESTVVHVDAGTRQVDARVAVPATGADALFALQGDRQGFVVGRSAVTVFGKSTLTVEGTLPTGQAEVPVGIEVVGGPYLVYRQAGTIVRLGVPPTSIQVGGGVAAPVATDDGTVWLRRPDTGVVCALRRDANALDCAPRTAARAPGALTVTGQLPGFLGTTDDAVTVFGATQADPVRPPVPVGVDLPDDALVADRDTRGWLPAVVVPNRLVLADSSGVPQGRAGGAPVQVDLGPGTFTSPVAQDGVVAVVEQTHNRLLTFAVDGRRLASADLPAGDGPASIIRGEDGQLYVDDADGASTHVIAADGTVTAISTGGATNAVTAPAASAVAAVLPFPPRAPTGSTGGGSPVREPAPVPKAPVPVAPQPVAPEPVQPDPVVPLPTAPGGVAATATGAGAVKVTWRAVTGAGDAVRYRVAADGGPSVETAGTAATLSGLAAGRTYTITVTATNETGTGAPSAAVTVTLISPAGQVRLLDHMTIEAHRSLDWGPPDQLGGGTLVGYQVTAKSSMGTLTQRVTGTEYHDDHRNDCLATTYTVWAVTRPAGGGPEVNGAPASLSLPTYDCNPTPEIVSATADATSADVVVGCTETMGPNDTRTTGKIDLALDGDQKWSGTCNIGTRTTVHVTGLDPGTTYTVTAGVPGDSAISGVSTSVTTAAA